MPRVPYRYPAPGEDAVADKIRERRARDGQALLPLDGALLNAPPFAEGWNAVMGAVRSRLSIPADVRELLILRVAALNGAAFEWLQHEPFAVQAGATRAQLRAVRDTSLSSLSLSSTGSGNGGALTPLQAAAVDLADAMTLRVKVPAAVFARLAECYRVEEEAASARAGADTGAVDEAAVRAAVERKVTETVAVVASYNMVSRFLVAMDVDDRADEEVPGVPPE